jgi:CRISPR-associated protein Cmr1
MACGNADFLAEVRPPSFRGVARFWLRALLGGVFGEDYQAVRTVENLIFGDTTRRSSFAVRTLDLPKTGQLPIDPAEAPGLAYLYYTLYRARRDAILPGEQFRLRLQTAPVPFPNTTVRDVTVDGDLAWRLVAASFWLTVWLGGISARVRRGAGALAFARPPEAWPAELPSPVVRATTPQQLSEEIAANLHQLRHSVGWQPVAQLAGTPTGNLLHPDVFDVYVLDQVYPTWHAALDAVGQSLQGFRQRQPDDYATVKGILTGQNIRQPVVKRSIFGLPLSFFFSSLYRSLTEQGVDEREARRRASGTLGLRGGTGRMSPLWVQVMELAGVAPAYVIRLNLIRSQFEDGALVFRPQDRAVAPVNVHSPDDYGYVEEWFEHLQQTIAPLLPANGS